MSRRTACALFFVLLLPALAAANPSVIVDLPIDLNTYSTPVIEVRGTVENSLSWPDGVSANLQHGFRTWVYFSVAGKPFELAATPGSGPDSHAHYGGTGSVTLFHGFGDLPFGTHSVRVYARDEFGRTSTTVSRTVHYPQPSRSPAGGMAVREGISRLRSLTRLLKSLPECARETLQERRERLIFWLGRQLVSLPESEILTIITELEGISLNEDSEALRSSLAEMLRGIRVLRFEQGKNP